MEPFSWWDQVLLPWPPWEVSVVCLPAFPGSHGSVILAGGTEGFRMGDQKLRAKTINASNSGIVVTCKGCVWIGS